VLVLLIEDQGSNRSLLFSSLPVPFLMSDPFSTTTSWYCIGSTKEEEEEEEEVADCIVGN